jgi:hypothetical protein
MGIWAPQLVYNLNNYIVLLSKKCYFDQVVHQKFNYLEVLTQ